MKQLSDKNIAIYKPILFNFIFFSSRDFKHLFLTTERFYRFSSIKNDPTKNTYQI